MYQIYFGNTLFPVAPEVFDIKISNRNTTLPLVNGGEINVPKTPGLTEYSFVLFLPAQRFHFSLYKDNKFKAPTHYLSVLEKLKTGRTVFEFSVLRSAKDNKKNISAKVTLEEYTIKESTENFGGLLIDIALLQYIHHGTKVVTIKDNSASGNTSSRPGSETDKKAGNKKYTIKAIDTLPSISKQFYGTQNRYMEIYRANKKLLDDIAVKRGFPAESGHWWIFPGTVITIP